jgi:hypothetical protein
MQALFDYCHFIVTDWQLIGNRLASLHDRAMPQGAQD